MAVNSAEELAELVATLGTQFGNLHEPSAGTLWAQADAHIHHAVQESSSWAVREMEMLLSEWETHKRAIQDAQHWFAHHAPNLARVSGDARKLATEAFAGGGAAIAGGAAWGAFKMPNVQLPGHLQMPPILPISKRFGFIGGPLLGDLPKIGVPIQVLQAGDQGFRLGQDLGETHYQDAYEQGSDTAAGLLMGSHTGAVGVLAGTDVIIGKHVEQAARAIDVPYTMHHMSQLNPFAPGAAKAVWDAEVDGFKSLGSDLGKSLVSAALSI